MHNALILPALLLTLIFCSSVKANEAPAALSLLNQPIGEQRSTTLIAVEQQWGSRATCTTIRTGFGLTRRAYFLETCALSNELGNTLYDETPATADYLFFEDRLVQVIYHFKQISKPEKFKRCARQDAEELASRQDSESESGSGKQGITVDENFRVSVSDMDMVRQIHALRDLP